MYKTFRLHIYLNLIYILEVDLNINLRISETNDDYNDASYDTTVIWCSLSS